MKVWSILLFIAIVVLVKEDIRNNGSFEESTTGMFLQDVKLYKQAFIFYSWADRFVMKSKTTIRNTFPDQYDTAAEVVEPVAQTLYVYANATVLSTKKWCYIITHQHTRDYLPTVKDNILYYHQEFKDSIENTKTLTTWFIFESDTSTFIKEKIASIWKPIEVFLEDTFSINIDLEIILEEIKSVLQTTKNYLSGKYEQIIDILNLERTI